MGRRLKTFFRGLPRNSPGIKPLVEENTRLLTIGVFLSARGYVLKPLQLIASPAHPQEEMMWWIWKKTPILSPN